MSKSRLSQLLKASMEDLDGQDTAVSMEKMSPRARAILKQFTMTADGADIYFGSKAESLAKKIEKLEAEIEGIKEAERVAKNAKVSNEAIIVSFEDMDEASLEGFKGAWEGYKEGAKAFWTKDGKLSFPSMKRYHDWMEKMQKEVDEKKARVKELKAELKKLAAEGKLKASKEDFDEERPLEVNDPDTAEAALADAAETEQEVQQTEGDVDRLTEIGEGLESICLELKASLEDGGLSPNSAKMLNLAVESYLKPLGFEQTPVPALESFEGQTSRVKATEISLESAGVVLKKIWEAIKAAALKFWDAIKSFVKQVADANERLIARAEKLAEAAGKASGNPKSSSLVLGSLAKRIAVNGKIGNPVSDFEKAVEVASGLNEFDDTQAKLMGEVTRALVDVQNATNDTVDAAIEKVKGMPVFSGDKAFSRKTNKGDNIEYATNDLPGGVRFVAEVGKFSIKAGKEDSAGNKGFDKDTKISTLSPADAAKIAKTAQVVADKVKLFRDAGKLAKAFQKEIEQKPAVSDEVSDETARKIAAVMREHSAQVQTCMSLGSKLYAYLVRTSLAFVALAEKSMAQYSGGAAKEIAATESLDGEEGDLSLSQEGATGALVGVLAGGVLGGGIISPLTMVAGGVIGHKVQEKGKVKAAGPGTSIRDGNRHGVIKKVYSKDFEYDGEEYEASEKKPMLLIKWNDADSLQVRGINGLRVND